MGTLYLTDGDDLTSVANAIRTKGGTSAQLAFPSGFVSAIAAIPSGGGDYDKLIDGTLVNASSSNVTTIRFNAFARLTSLESASFPNATKVLGSAFNAAENLVSIYLPLVTVLDGGNNFEKVKASTIVLPSLTTINGSYTFRNNTHLQAVDFGNPSSLPNQGFAGDTSLGIIILRNPSTIAGLVGVNALNNTKFASGGAGGTIYIKKALYDHLGDGTSLDYKAATNWSTINGYGTITWAKIEGSIYENAYADGTPIS